MSENIHPQSVLNKSKKDKFLLVFDVPPILKTFSKSIQSSPTNSTISPDSVQFSIYGTMVPDITVPAVEVRNTGNTLYVSSHSKNSYPPVSVKFTIDNQYRNYWVMYQWLNLQHDEKYGIYNAKQIVVDDNFKDYQTDLTIYGKDEFDNNRIKFTYKGAFPTSVDEIEYDYQSDAEELISGFTFVYSQLHTELISF